MNNVICEHTLQLGQTPIKNRFCDSYKQGMQLINVPFNEMLVLK